MRKTLTGIVVAAAVAAFAGPALACEAMQSAQKQSTTQTVSADQVTKPVQQTQVPSTK
jgi:hypothetical protein